PQIVPSQSLQKRIEYDFNDLKSKWMATMKTLDIEAVQAFVLTADFKSFTRAAEALDTTQSAVSLKIKRLEDGLGRRLLERTPRLARPSADGEPFPGPGRKRGAHPHGANGSLRVL